AVSSIVERAEGNAFFLEELIRAVAEGRNELPDTVLGIVQTRLDAVGSEGKRLLRVASIFGRRFRRDAVVALSGGNVREVDGALAELAAHELVLRRTSASNESMIEYAFRHAVLRDASYAMLPDADRVSGHLRAGAWLEANGESDAVALAEHYDRGRQPERA